MRKIRQEYVEWVVAVNDKSRECYLITVYGDVIC